MMFAGKKERVDYSGKKYLFVIVVLMLIAALGLSIVSLFKKEKGAEGLENNNSIATEAVTEEGGAAVAQSYAAEIVLEPQADDLILGNKEAGLKIFVYEDYGDVLSAKFSENINTLLEERSDDIAFILRPFILSAKSGENALALECAAAEGKWLALRKMIFAFLLGQEKPDKELVAGEELLYYAEKAGLNTEAFSACLTNGKKSGKIEQLAAAAMQSGIKGSPTIFVGEEMLLGARPLDDYTDSNGDHIEGLKSLIDRVLEKK